VFVWPGGRRKRLFDRRARIVMRSVAVSVLIWLALSYIVWCTRTGDGEHLFRRRGFCLK
jgi:hypothetical protein